MNDCIIIDHLHRGRIEFYSMRLTDVPIAPLVFYVTLCEHHADIIRGNGWTLEKEV